MRRLFVVAAVLFSGVGGGAQDTSSLPRILSFEVDHPAGVPGGWSVSPPGSAQADEKIVRGGRWSARIERAVGSAGEFSGISKGLAGLEALNGPGCVTRLSDESSGDWTASF
jgi:hypothetical protein